MKHSKEIEFMKTAVERAYAEISREEMRVTDKGEFDSVTNLDYGMEKVLLAMLKESFPDDRVVSEEFNTDNELGGRCWTIDPIDGTVNMAHNTNMYGVQIAFLIDQSVEASLIYLPCYNEMYTAVRGEGAFCNGKRVCVAKRRLGNCMVSLGDFSHRKPVQSEQQMRLVERLRTKVSKLRLYGAACVDFAFLASGRTDAMIMFTKHLWDIAPGWLLSEEAGAKVVNLKGEAYTFGDDEILAIANEELAQLMIEK